MNKPLNLSDLIANRLLSHTVSLFRFDAHLRTLIRRMLAERVQRELVNELVRADPSTIQRRAFRDRNVEALSAEAKAITRTGYRAVALAHDKAMAELADVEEEFARTAVNRVAGMDLLTITVPDKRLKQIARSTLIGSPKKKAVAADWWAGQADDVRKAFTQAVNAGLAEGESIGEIIARVRGTHKAAFTDGVVSFRDAEALVRTSVLSVSNAVRMEALKQNSDVVRGVQVLVTLDSRTSDTCLALGSANAAWDLEGKPLPESGWQYPQPPGPPFHWNCRTILVPVIGKLEDILGEVGDVKAARLEGLSTTMQESMDGRLAESAGMTDWLNSKSDAFVNDLLGKTKAGLWRNGKLKVSQLVDQSLRPLNLDQLKEKVRGVTDKAIETARAA